MSINWDLIGGAPDIGASFMSGYDGAQKRVQQARLETATRNYAANPTDKGALGALAAVAPPELALSIGNQEATRQRAIAEKQRVGEYYKNPDHAAGAAQAYGAGEVEIGQALDKLSDDKKKQLGEMYKAAGGVAFGALKIPDAAQRKAYIMTNAPMLSDLGWPPEKIMEVANDPSDARLDGLVRTSTSVESLLPKNIPTVPGGGVFSQDPVSGETRTLVAPNPGGVEAGAPVGANVPPPPPGFTLDAPGGQTPSASGTCPPSGNNPRGGLTIMRNNNEGALRKPGSMEFQRFATPEAGRQAQVAQLARYHQRGLDSVSSVIETYSPRKSRGGDNTDAQVNNYIGYVAKRLGVDPRQPLPRQMVPSLAQAMREFETGRRVR